MPRKEDAALLEIIRLRTLLEWAIEFVENEANIMEQSNKGADGQVDDPDAAAEIRNARKWLEDARRK